MLIAKVLGETELLTEAGEVVLGARLARRFATVLVLAGGERVSDDAIVEALWGEHAPDQATASIQAYVSRLRRSLGPERDRLTRWGEGYRLRLDGSDVEDFERAAARAAAELDDRPDQAAAAADEAIRMWRGEPYADLTDAPATAADRVRLTELYETAVETGLDARLRLGEAAQVVAAARAAIDASPFRERRWGLLVLALYRTGRQSDALQALREVRRMLDDELGIDPGPELQELERRVFSSDTALLLSAPPAALPPIKASVARPLTTFRGRASDLHALVGLAEAERLVTVTGPGGVGKTRLLLEWAADRSASTGQLWVVRLADLTMDDLLPAVVARAVGLVEVDADPVAALAAALENQSGVLVLDNCEHLIGQVAPFVSNLLGTCKDLTVIATSREPLQVDGEAVLPLEPLAVLDTDGADGAAVELLRDRITRVRPGWAPDAAELADLRLLCTLLDGLPLGLELAAARTRSLSLRDIIARLDGRFDALAEVPTGSVAPHRTLAGTVAWSVDLLTPRDHGLLNRLWPFEGGFDLELAVEVAGPEASDTVLGSLSSLVTKSLVVADTGTSPTRYRLWEVVRAYVRERDAETGAHRMGQAASTSILVLKAAEVLSGPRSSRAMTVLNRELANIRAMLQHDLEIQPQRALRSFLSLGWFWYRAGLNSEGLSWIQRLRAAVPDLTATDRAQLLATAVPLHNALGDQRRTVAALDALARELAQLPESGLHGQLTYFRAIVSAGAHRYDDALDQAEQAIAIGARTCDRAVETNGHLGCGLARIALGEIEAGRTELQVATALALDGGTPWTGGMAALYLGQALLNQPEPQLDDAERSLRLAVTVFTDEADVGNLTQTLGVIAQLLARQGEPEQAEHVLRTAVHAARRLGIPQHDATLVPPGFRVNDKPNDSAAEQDQHLDPLTALRTLAAAWRTRPPAARETTGP